MAKEKRKASDLDSIVDSSPNGSSKSTPVVKGPTYIQFLNPKIGSGPLLEKMTFTGTNYNEQGLENKNVQYFVGVHDKSNSSVLFKKAPLMSFTASVTALNEKESEYNKSIKDKMYEAKQDLGLTFGSKKKKTQIRADNRNRVDLTSISTTENDIKASIESRTKNMPTMDELKEEANELRPIPLFNSTEIDVTKVYDMSDVSPMFAVYAAGKLLADDYPADVVEIGKLLKIESGDLRNFAKLSKSFEGLSKNALNHLIHTFTEMSIMRHGKKGNVMTKFCQDKLTCYIAVLMLSINNWEIEPVVFSKELGVTVATASDYLRSVGCKIDNKFDKNKQNSVITKESEEIDEDAESAENNSASTQAKAFTAKAYLVAPLVFPSARRFVKK
ncbi:hypothetical protein BB561_000597 [Smittium simulii]|uniref:DNA-directed RNA polymerase I subunit RPA49 n=1 Tax=Smittium simulii TaxID=133385 RepID=A0A2T9YYK8_9FUNG|nr:hypothetical protein BB561_000597 [Smittium simulii]